MLAVIGDHQAGGHQCEHDEPESQRGAAEQ
jgi:hypothetical protein